MSAKRLLRYARRYRKYHSQYPKRLGGKFTELKTKSIADLVFDLDISGPPRLLDYGSGKGYQYLGDRVHEQWGGHLPICYDPGVRQLARRPTGKFDVVICTDVLEHIEVDDLPAVLEEVFGYADTSVYFHICCRPAWKSFEDGVNLHVTVKPPAWWDALLTKLKPPHVKLVVTYEV